MIRLLTLNIRIQSTFDGGNAFVRRKNWLIPWILSEMPDIIGLQEVRPKMLEILQAEMPDYAFVGAPNGRGIKSAEHTAIAYRKQTIVLEETNTFWLSNSPRKCASRFVLQSPDPRTCTWAAVFHIPSGTRFRYFNTHLDHISPLARNRGIRIILRHIAALQAQERLPLFFGGDFNLTPQSKGYQYCRQRDVGVQLVDLTASVPSTFHWFGSLRKPMKLDYLFTDRHTAKGGFDVWVQSTDADGRYLSDHHAIRVDWNPTGKGLRVHPERYLPGGETARIFTQ